MRQTTQRITVAFVFALLALGLSSCTNKLSKTSDLEFDSFMTPDKPTLRQSDFNLEVETAKLDTAALRGVGDEYRRNGEGPVSVVISYDPSSHAANTASHATEEAARIARVLEKSGIANVKTDILPAAVKGSPSKTLLSFRALVAQAPANCQSMGGLDGKQTMTDLDYHIGCTTEMQEARQIAHPQDLEGRAGLDNVGSARRQAGVLDTYQKGTPNPALQNTQSSTSSQSQ